MLIPVVTTLKTQGTYKIIKSGLSESVSEILYRLNTCGLVLPILGPLFLIINFAQTINIDFLIFVKGHSKDPRGHFVNFEFKTHLSE